MPKVKKQGEREQSLLYHNHHINPRHLGGSNRLDNLVKVTIEEHAKIHHSLWILGGRWQDEVAWKTLSGQITPAAATKEAQRMTGKKMWPKGHIPWNKNKTGSQEAWNKGKKGYCIDSEETKLKKSLSLKKAYEEGRKSNKGQIPWNKGIPRTEEEKQKISLGMKSYK